MRLVISVSFFVFVISLCEINDASAQDSVILISGRILDLETRLPVPFSNIQVAGKTFGTSANSEGEFVFKVRREFIGDTLVISSIGYGSYKIAISRSKPSVTFLLKPATIELKEVVIKGESALEIIKKVLARVPANYDTSDFHMMAFYRENIGLADFQLAYSEAVLDILKTFKTGRKDPKDELRVLKGRKRKINFSSDPQFYYWISGISNGARFSLSEDVIKNRDQKYSSLNPRNFKHYTFSYGEPTQNGERNLLVIDILPRKKDRHALFTGKLYIDETSLAIVKSELELTPAGVRFVERKDKNFAYTIMSAVVSATLDYHKFVISVTYKEFNGKWYLSSVSRNFQLLVNSKKRKMKDRLWKADMTLQITDIDLLNKEKITTGNIGNSGSSVGNLIGKNYDEAFWEHFNIVKPVIPDSLKKSKPISDSLTRKRFDNSNSKLIFSNRDNGFTRSDTLRGKLTPLRTCYDVTFYHLDVAVDMDEHSVKGSNIIRFTVKQPFDIIQVDLYANMKIEKILYHGQPLEYTRESDVVFVRFPEMLKLNSESEIKIYYAGTPQIPDWRIPMKGGILWDKDNIGNPWAQVVCQGSGASLWWPNKDHLSDEPDSMKIWITVPDSFSEISNGRLQKKTPMGDSKTRYEWLVTYPINNYNVTFNIGKYAHYRDFLITNDTLTLDYYVMPYNLDNAHQMFEQVRPMLTCFEKYFGKYPFPRDGFTLIESLYPMEHQSGVCIGKINKGIARQSNPLLWHESAHEWWGNAISCTDLADMWMHEAFATYAESLNIECQYGKQAAISFLNEEKPRILNHEPIIGERDVNHIFYNIEDMYSKGALVLNTFRSVIDNDSLWFRLLLDIQEHFHYKTLTSDQLITYINEETKKNYNYFFDQYLKFKSLPTLDVELTEEQNNLSVKYRWATDVKDFRMPIKVSASANAMEFIYPETTWKTLKLANMDVDDFNVDENGFLINVNLKDE